MPRATVKLIFHWCVRRRSLGRLSCGHKRQAGAAAGSRDAPLHSTDLVTPTPISPVTDGNPPPALFTGALQSVYETLFLLVILAAFLLIVFIRP